jgi:hypothetical protein
MHASDALTPDIHPHESRKTLLSYGLDWRVTAAFVSVDRQIGVAPLVAKFLDLAEQLTIAIAFLPRS